MFIRYAVMMAIIDRNVVTMIASFFCLLGGHSISGHSISGHQNESSIQAVGLRIARLGVLLGGLSFGKFVPVGANQRVVEHRMFFSAMCRSPTSPSSHAQSADHHQRGQRSLVTCAWDASCVWASSQWDASEAAYEKPF